MKYILLSVLIVFTFLKGFTQVSAYDSLKIINKLKKQEIQLVNILKEEKRASSKIKHEIKNFRNLLSQISIIVEEKGDTTFLDPYLEQLVIKLYNYNQVPIFLYGENISKIIVEKKLDEKFLKHKIIFIGNDCSGDIRLPRKTKKINRGTTGFDFQTYPITNFQYNFTQRCLKYLNIHMGLDTDIKLQNELKNLK